MQSKVDINNSWYSKSLDNVSVMFFVFCTKNELKKVKVTKLINQSVTPSLRHQRSYNLVGFL